MNVAVIPARGGSKGITKKNLQKISGLSLVARAIKVCIESKMFSAVFLSTDSHEIAQEARKYGAQVINRPKSLSEDNTSTDPVINHAIKEIENLGIKFKYISLVQATYPFLDVEHIKEVIAGFKKPFDCAFGASEFHGFIWQEHKSKFHLANRNFDFKFRPRRQDQKTQLLELGSIYMIEKEAFLRTKSRFGSNPIPIKIRDAVPFEIDSLKDLEICRSIMKRENKLKLKEIMKNVNFIITDFDGVLTDNKVLTDSNGVESINCNKSDSLAIGIMKTKFNIEFQILTSEESKTHFYRSKKLGINLNVTKNKKSEIVNKLIKSKNNNNKKGTLYIGNDLNDMDAFDYVDYSLCPSDSHEKVQARCDFILNSQGGQGVFKELLIALESH